MKPKLFLKTETKKNSYATRQESDPNSILDGNQNKSMITLKQPLSVVKLPQSALINFQHVPKFLVEVNHVL